MKLFHFCAQVAFACVISFALTGCSGSSGSNTTISGNTSFVQASQFALPEDSGSSDIVVHVMRQGTRGTALVRVDVVDGTALPGVDFTLNGGPTHFVTFPDGSATQQLVLGTVLDDAIVEGTETIELKLSNITPGLSLGDETRLTLEILDSDAPPQGAIQFGQGIGIVDETSGTLGIPITRTAGALDSVTAEVLVVGGFAVEGADFTVMNQIITWAALDDADKFLNLSIFDDTLKEGSEQVVLEIFVTTGGAAIGTRKTYFLEIIDDDVGGEIKFLSAIGNVMEGDDVTVTLVRSGGSGGVATVDVRDTGLGTAFAPTDFLYSANYVPSLGETVTWADGEVGPKSVVFSILEDGVVEPPETIELELVNPTGDVVPSNTGNTFRINISDVSAPSLGDIAFALSHQEVNENASTVNVGIGRFNGADLAVDVDFVVTAETAQEGIDFAYIGTGTISWASGEAGIKTISINILDDAIVEEDETFRVSLVGVSPGATISSEDVVVTIIDNEIEAWPTIGIPTTEIVRDLKFFGADFGWAVCDGGQIWERSSLSFNNGFWTQRPSGTTADLNAVIGEPSLGALVVGAGGTILVAEAANNHQWVAQVSNTTENLNDVAFGKDPNLTTNVVRYFAVGDNGTILRSVNTFNWNVLNSGSTENLNAVRFVNLNRGWAVGNNGTILRTVDGGLNWVAQTSGTTVDLHDVYFFAGSQEGTAVGDNGTILRTVDAGVTWSQQTSGTTENLYAVEGAMDASLFNHKYRLIVGANGTIIDMSGFATVWSPQVISASTDFYALSYGTLNRIYLGGDHGEVRVGP